MSPDREARIKELSDEIHRLCVEYWRLTTLPVSGVEPTPEDLGEVVDKLTESESQEIHRLGGLAWEIMREFAKGRTDLSAVKLANELRSPLHDVQAVLDQMERERIVYRTPSSYYRLGTSRFEMERRYKGGERQ